ncbi:MAG: hypothetical protein IPJ69_12765 [Deltaproteobacteria bacterium]|nr:MAG: hypothetical protein IPJ69_12765 [Deltaproteobacteria bacterium]
MLGTFLAIVFVNPLYAKTQVSIGIGVPLFYPAPDFRYDDGYYYRKHDHHYYHYDEDRHGWHYGRNHQEGMREESRREKNEKRHHGRH